MDNRRRMMLAGGISANPVLENNDWETISKVARAGKAAEFWKVGDLKNISIGGVTYAAQIIGFDHDNVTDPATYGREKAGITFQLQNCYATEYNMASKNVNNFGWSRCFIRQAILPNIKAAMQQEVKDKIVFVNKKTSAGSDSNTINITQDDLFLLSEIEIFGSIKYSKAGEGNQYKYYADGNSKIKTVPGTSRRYWWERSPYSKTGYCIVFTSDANAGYSSDSYGVAFAFCV